MRRKSSRKPTKIDELLRDRLGALKLGRGLEASEVCAAFEALATGRLGDEAPVRAVSFKEGRLKVEVPDGVWASELRLRLPELQKELNALLGGEKVGEVRLVVGSSPRERREG